MAPHFLTFSYVDLKHIMYGTPLLCKKQATWCTSLLFALCSGTCYHENKKQNGEQERMLSGT